MLAIVAAEVVLYACAPRVPIVTTRIDWSHVPEAGPYAAPKPTRLQRALKRGAHDEYIALQFERKPLTKQGVNYGY
jgi:hypothetical protein